MKIRQFFNSLTPAHWLWLSWVALLIILTIIQSDHKFDNIYWIIEWIYFSGCLLITTQYRIPYLLMRFIALFKRKSDFIEFRIYRGIPFRIETRYSFKHNNRAPTRYLIRKGIIKLNDDGTTEFGNITWLPVDKNERTLHIMKYS